MTTDQRDSMRSTGSGASKSTSDLLADFSSAMRAARSEDDIYQHLAGWLRLIVGDAAVICVTDYELPQERITPRVILGLGDFQRQVTELLGQSPETLAGAVPASVRQALSAGRLTRLKGDVAELIGDAIPPDRCRALIEILSLREVHALGFSKSALSGGVYIITRQPEMVLRQTVIEALMGLASGAIEHLRTASTLRESEERYRNLVELAPEVIYTLSFDGALTSLNSAFERLTGWPREAWYGKPFAGLIHPEDLLVAAETFHASLRGELTPPNILRILSKSGQYRVAEIASCPLVEQGRVIGELGIARDITARVRAEEALRTSEERLRRLSTCLSSLGTAYHSNIEQLTALCGQLLGATCALYNRLEGDLLCSVGQWNTPPDYQAEDNPEGHLCHDVIRSQEQGALVVRALSKTAYANSDPNVSRYGLETYMGHPVYRGARAVGSVCVVYVRDVDPTPEDRHVLGLIAMALSREEERLSSEEAQRAFQSELAQAHKLESVGQLAGGVAHDFNNMLAVILNNTEFALEQVDRSSQLAADLLEIRKAARHSAGLTRQLLAFARKQIILPEVIDLNGAVSGSLGMLQRMVGEAIELDWRPKEQVGQIHIDPTQLDQVLVNLLINARDATSGVGKITIGTARAVVDETRSAEHRGVAPGPYVVLSVTDTGCGMDQATIARLFEPFFTTKELGLGTGLGLSTIHGIVKQNGGHVTVDSEVGRGTTFRIYLPLISHTSSAAPIAADKVGDLQEEETILLVEDEPALLKLGLRMLEQLGYTVLTATSPDAALCLAREHGGAIHLLVTDVVMPKMNGRDLANELKALYPAIRSLFISGYPADAISHHGILDQEVCFLPKPFSREELAVKVREALVS